MLAATYISSSQFSVAGNYVALFETNLALKCEQGADGVASVYVVTAAFSAGTGLTTVTVTPTSLTTHLTNVLIPYVSPSSLPSGIVGVGGGAEWRSGSGVPSNSLGVDGDYYLDTATGNVYAKASGAYTLVCNIKGATGNAGNAGDTGPAGSPGSVWREGSGSPSNGTGIDGDYYLNTINGDVYKRASGTYSVVDNIQGPQGPAGGGSPGSTWREGSGVPSDGLGINGDFYLNGSTGDVYQKAAGTYGSVLCNIKGATGSTGSTGSVGATGAAGTPGSVWREGSGTPSNGTGVDGDLYLNGSTGDVYQRVSGSYSIVCNIKGPTGSTGGAGTNGTDGAAGSVWRNGSGAPSNGLGIDGDYYLNTANGDVYLRASGTYSVVCNITGPGGGGGGWPATSYSDISPGISSDGSTNHAGKSWRMAVPANVAAATGTKIQIQITAPAATSVSFDHVSVVPQSSGANGTGTPTEITFLNGGHGIVVPAGKSIWSDVITYGWTASAVQLITMDVTNSGTTYARTGAASGYTDYYKNAVAAYWNQQNMSPDGTNSNQSIWVSAIRVFA